VAPAGAGADATETEGVGSIDADGTGCGSTCETVPGCGPSCRGYGVGAPAADERQERWSAPQFCAGRSPIRCAAADVVSVPGASWRNSSV